MSSYAYYPGCSLTSTALEYDISFRRIAGALGIGLDEIQDWNCCGASPAPHHGGGDLGKLLPARNVHIAAGTPHEGVVAPCAGCYNKLKTSQYELIHSQETREMISRALHEEVNYETEVLNLVELLEREIDLEDLRQRSEGRFEGTVLAPYYGCMLTRPPEIMKYDNPGDPTGMDGLLEATGAEVPFFPFKSECCGSYVGVSRKEIVLTASRRIIDVAVGMGIEALVTACPLCQQNLDLRQHQINRHFGTDYKLPVLYLTQVIGLAIGIGPEELGIKALAVRPDGILKKVSDPDARRAAVEAKAAKAGKGGKKKKKAQKAEMAAGSVDQSGKVAKSTVTPEAEETPGGGEVP